MSSSIFPVFSCHGLSNPKEASDLTEAAKQTLYEEYLQAYSEDSEIRISDCENKSGGG